MGTIFRRRIKILRGAETVHHVIRLRKISTVDIGKMPSLQNDMKLKKKARPVD